MLWIRDKSLFGTRDNANMRTYQQIYRVVLSSNPALEKWQMQNAKGRLHKRGLTQHGVNSGSNRGNANV